MRKNILTLTLAALMLSACADVPDTVRERAENSSVTDSLESKADSDLVYDTVENVTKNAANVLGNKYQNIVLSEDMLLDVAPAEKAYIIKGSGFADEGAADLDKMLEDFTLMFAGEKPQYVVPYGIRSYEVDAAPYLSQGLDPSDFGVNYEGYQDQQPMLPDGCGYSAYGIDKYSVNITSGGDITAYYTDEWRIKGSNFFPYIRSYDLLKDDIEGVSYSVAGEDYPLTEALEFADSYVKNELAPFLENYDGARAVKVYIGDGSGNGEEVTDPGNHYYYFVYEQTVGNIPFSRYGFAQKPEYMAKEYLHIGIFAPGKVEQLGKCDFFVSEKNEQDKLITLESALAHAEKLLAPFEVYKPVRISLEYSDHMITQTDGSDVSYEFHPMWVLTLSDTDMNKIDVTFEQRRAIFIDAVTGDVMLWDDGQGRFLFGGEA